MRRCGTIGTQSAHVGGFETSIDAIDYDRAVPTVGEIMSSNLLAVEGSVTLADAARQMHERLSLIHI